MERSHTQGVLTYLGPLDKSVLTVDYRDELDHELSEARDQLAGDHAERSRHLIEGATSAEHIRHSTEEVADYINGLATDMYFRLRKEEGLSGEDTAVRIDAFIAEQTHLLLGGMAEKRSQDVAVHSRFIPKPLSGLYDKALQKWRSWEVPTGDGELVSRLRNTETWQNLEEKTESTKRSAKLGRFALTVVASSINGVENLVKYTGARKRLAAMAGLGIVSGAAAGALLGVVGAGTAGAFVGGMAARTMVRSGLSTKLNSDANIDAVSIYDQVRMGDGIDQLTTDAYSVDELLSYVDVETKKMLYENNAKLMGGLAIGIVGGFVGNGVARGMSWLAGQYIDANFNTVAHAESLNGDANHVIKSTHIAPNHVIDGLVPNHVIDGSPRNIPNHVIGGVTPNHVIDGSETKIVPNHVIDGSNAKNHPNHVIDGSKVISEPTAEKPSSKDTFIVEGGHGFIREIQDYAREHDYKEVSSADAYKIYKQLLKEHGINGLIDVHGIKKDIYVEDGDVRINAAGKANWRTGVESDLESLMHQHKHGDKLLSLHHTSEPTQTDHVIEGSNDKNHPNHVINADGPARSASLSGPTSVVDGAVDSANVPGSGNSPVSVIEGTSDASNHLSTTNSFTTKELNVYGDDTKPYRRALAGVTASHRADVLKAAAPQLQSLKLTEKVDGVWRFREVSSLSPKVTDILQRIAAKNHWTLAA